MSANQFAHFAPAHIQKLVAYDPGHEPSVIAQRLGLDAVIELGSNENSIGPCPAVKALLANPQLLGFRYPDAGGNVLKNALAAHYGLSPAHFTLGNGTHELLTLIAETFCTPGDEVVHAQFGFAVYRLAALGAGAVPIAAPSDADLNVTPASMLAAITPRTKLVYLANPNNPTATMWTLATLRQFLEALPKHVLFVLDEAYIEYVRNSGVSNTDVGNSLCLLAEFPQLVIARTFSKAYALASLRVGYTIAHPEFAQMLERTRLSFNVNVLALKAAVLAIADQAHIALVRETTALQREFLVAGLRKLGLRVLPSECNFVLVHFAKDASAIEQALVQQGVIVRPMRGYGLAEYLRITVGNTLENQRLLAALEIAVTA
jgi:histidinol-phosphate aminotransferase